MTRETKEFTLVFYACGQHTKSSIIQKKIMLRYPHFEVIIKGNQCFSCAWTPGTVLQIIAWCHWSGWTLVCTWVWLYTWLCMSLKLLRPENSPKMMGNWVWVVLLEQADGTRWPPEVPSSFNHSVILMIRKEKLGVDSAQTTQNRPKYSIHFVLSFYFHSCTHLHCKHW